jgi:hypothetical protein
VAETNGRIVTRDVQLAGYVLFTKDEGAKHGIELLGVRKFDSTYEVIFRDENKQWESVKAEFLNGRFRRYANCVRDIKDAGKAEERETCRPS